MYSLFYELSYTVNLVTLYPFIKFVCACCVRLSPLFLRGEAIQTYC